LQTGWEGFFPYYAGFPEKFARSLLQSARLSSEALVLDPWNGSGTTTYAASRLGFSSCGFDLNPVMVIIGRARLLAATEADSIEPLAAKVTKSARMARKLDDDDPLCEWFGTNTAGHIRGLERSIRHHLVGDIAIACDGVHLDRLSCLAATFYVALFSVCRELAARFRSSNPTWLRKPRNDERRICASRGSIGERFRVNLASMAAALLAEGGKIRPNDIKQSEPNIRLADATMVTMDPGAVDFILTSPPYCTRIDYTAATRIELAVLAPLLDVTRKELARGMMGSIRVPDHEIAPRGEWGKTCIKFLGQLRDHDSKASSGYYYKTHLDYFEKMSLAMARLTKALKKNGIAVLVVQDSYYKEIHNNLPQIVCEIGEIAGLEMQRSVNFRLRRSMSGINPYSRSYERPSGATEAVLCFRKTK
jgi:DNA modification methylase